MNEGGEREEGEARNQSKGVATVCSRSQSGPSPFGGRSAASPAAPCASPPAPAVPAQPQYLILFLSKHV